MSLEFISIKFFKSFREFLDTVLIDDIIKDYPVYGGPLQPDNYIYRGLATDKYTLVPTALRESNKFKLFKYINDYYDVNDFDVMQVQAEYNLLKKFYQFANNNGLKVKESPFINSDYHDFESGFDIGKLRSNFIKWYPEEFKDLAALAQHYGVPTRMLDWTQDINVALYFAATGAIERVLNSKELYTAMIGGKECGEKIIIWAFDCRMLQFSKYFRKKEEQKNYSPLKVVIPSYCDNPNLNAQKGVLTYWETDIPPVKAMRTDRCPLDELISKYCEQNPTGAKISMVRYELPISECTMIYKYLRKQGYTAARLFPGYAGVSKQIEEDRKYEILHTCWLVQNKIAK